MTMKRLLSICLLCTLVTGISSASPCTEITVYGHAKELGFRCTGLTTLRNHLDEARANTTIITIFDSDLREIPGHAFARFGASLVTLDLHESGIETCDTQAFVGLTKLQRLLLWGNKLPFVRGEWFANTQSLKTLDLSFNLIQGIDYTIFRKLPNLENFYFDYNQLHYIDYNMFAYLGNLKRVKFSKNPWNWAYRARLTWTLENQKVEAPDVWEDWNWMNVVVKDCVEDGHGELPSDGVLDCAVGRLLTFAYGTFGAQERSGSTGCNEQAKRLVRCMRPVATNATVADLETVRRILEDYSAVLPSMHRALNPFPLKR